MSSLKYVYTTFILFGFVSSLAIIYISGIKPEDVLTYYSKERLIDLADRNREVISNIVGPIIVGPQGLSIKLEPGTTLYRLEVAGVPEVKSK